MTPPEQAVDGMRMGFEQWYVDEQDAGGVLDRIVERYEDKNGVVRLSREKARREEAWAKLATAFEKNERVTGSIFGRVTGNPHLCDQDTSIAFDVT